MIKKEIEKYVSIIKNDEHKCYICLKIETPNDLPTFIVRHYIPNQDFNYYACLDKDQAFFNLEDDIAYFKSKAQVIVFGDMDACTRSFQLDAQQCLMPHIPRIQDIYKCIIDHLFDGKDLDKFWKLLH